MSAQVEAFDDLDAVARDAGGALDRAAGAEMFERLDWFRLVHDLTPPPGKLLTLRARNDVARGWLFLSKEGAKAVPLSNWYSLRCGPVIEGAQSESVLDGLAEGLRRAGVGELALSPLGDADGLEAALKRKGWITRRSQSTVNWRVRTAGLSFDLYWAARPSRLRNTAKRRTKAAGLELRVHAGFDPSAWADYETVYEHSWKPAEGSPPLMRRFAEAEGAAGTLRLGLAYRDGAPVAAQLWTVEHGVATIHKLAYREDAKQHSPGTVLSVEMFRRAIDEDKVEWIDFGIGDDGYKAEWMEEAKPLYALVAFDARSWRGLLALGRAAGAKLVGRLRSR
jgi:hypothetical protein